MFIGYRKGELCVEHVPLERVAQAYGTPTYVYSSAAIRDAYRAFARALGNHRALICFSVKSNSNLAVLSLLAREGAGFDIVSGGELSRVEAVGGAAGKTVFSGVGKTEAEIVQALRAGILCLNVESEQELERIDDVAGRLGIRAPVALRVNPDVDARTHPYISTGLRRNKFGVPIDDAERLYRRTAGMANIDPVGIGCHVGSQLIDASPFAEAAARLGALARRLRACGIALEHLDLGGGIGIRYQDESPDSIDAFVRGAIEAIGPWDGTLIVDPGRAIVGNAGVLLTRVEFVKHGEEKNFLIVDAAMNDLLRPALYEAWHEIRPVREPAEGSPARIYDVVGPVCESGDFLAKDRPMDVRAGDLLAVMSAGAYGMSMSSNYNTRPRAAEVLIDGEHLQLVRRRESFADLIACERLPA